MGDDASTGPLPPSYMLGLEITLYCVLFDDIDKPATNPPASCQQEGREFDLDSELDERDPILRVSGLPFLAFVDADDLAELEEIVENHLDLEIHL
ncbi:hypothetical protein QBC39DRAFT_375347 [Podospora conica]|nr:hypothetical protein QBC39DRAFT_375347 [Schizothecium conicum]